METNEYVEVERYWLNEPYCYASIKYHEDLHDYSYFVVEPELNDDERIILHEITENLRDVLISSEIESENSSKEEIIRSVFDEIISDYGFNLNEAQYEKILYYILRDFLGFGKIDGLMRDRMIEDISCNGPRIPVFVYHRNYGSLETNIIFSDERELNSYVIKLAQEGGKHISIAEPIVDATLKDGSRIQLTLGDEITTRGSTFTIRKFQDIPITPVDLIKWNTFSAEEMAYFWLCVENKKNVLFVGGTASGKTSSLNAISFFIPQKSKIVSIEDTREIKLLHPNWIPSVTRETFIGGERGSVDMYDLLKAALRQRPEYIIVGEVRGSEAVTLFQAMATGHATLSTLHADSIEAVIHRLENPPIGVPRVMMESLNIISIQSLVHRDKKRMRRNTEISEILRIEPVTRNVRTSRVFLWDPVRDAHVRVGGSKALESIKTMKGWEAEDLERELEDRKKVLLHLVSNDITDYKEIWKIIHAYQSNKERLMEKLGL
jgi:flagellar protein FlaI